MHGIVQAAVDSCSSLPWIRDLKTYDNSAMYIFSPVSWCFTKFQAFRRPRLVNRLGGPTTYVLRSTYVVKNHILQTYSTNTTFPLTITIPLGNGGRWWLLEIHAVATKHQQNFSPQTFIVTCQMKLGSRNRFLHHWKRTGFDILTGRVCQCFMCFVRLGWDIEYLGMVDWLTMLAAEMFAAWEFQVDGKLDTHTHQKWLVVSWVLSKVQM